MILWLALFVFETFMLAAAWNLPGEAMTVLRIFCMTAMVVTLAMAMRRLLNPDHS